MIGYTRTMHFEEIIETECIIKINTSAYVICYIAAPLELCCLWLEIQVLSVNHALNISQTYTQTGSLFKSKLR